MPLAHIHFGQEGVNGGVAAFLCGDGKPACPQGSGTVTGTIVAADVKAIAAQGLEANDIGVDPRDEGRLHVRQRPTAEFGTGEIRGQIGDDDDDTEDTAAAARANGDNDDDD